MATFELDSPFRAVREAIRLPRVPKALWAASAGIFTASVISIGLATTVAGGIDDPAPYPNAKAAPAPASELLRIAVADPQSAWNASKLDISQFEAALQGGSASTDSPVTAVVTESAEEAIVRRQVLIIPGIMSNPSAEEPVAPVVLPSVPEAPAAPVVEPAPAAPEVPAPVVEPALAATPNFYLPAYVGSNATLESRLLAGINGERAKAGLAPYASDASLVQVARTRSQQMVDEGYFGHLDSNGNYMYTALLSWFGVGYNSAGENLAVNNYSPAESADRALISLMNSPTHRANILAGDFTTIGIGVVVHPDGRQFYSMIFTG